MSLYSDRNLYPGVNAHLNSLLQNEPGGWRNFHSLHVTHLFEKLEAVLPSGYFARTETTLQIDEVSDEYIVRRITVPDVTIFGAPSGEAVATAKQVDVLTLPLLETMTETETLTGITIYQVGEARLGRPVTRIEVLSPANKPGGSHGEQYTLKRWQTLQSGLRLVEIDYLHQTPPVIPPLLNYSAGAKGASPYHIIVSDPRPVLEKGSATIYRFGVDDAIPSVRIPLAGTDTVILPLGEVYNRTFESSRFFRGVVDYAMLPERFDLYTDADQETIKRRLEAIRGQTS